MGASTGTAGEWLSPLGSSPDRRQLAEAAIVCTYLVLCCGSLIPFLAIAQPPIVDFANHAARLTLACNPGDPAVAAMYRYQFAIIPNLAIDLVNAPLCGIVSPSMVLRLVTAGSLSLIYFSAWLIQQRLFGRANAFLFLLPAIAFNLVTTMGYMNFLAGVSLTYLLVALSIGREQRFERLLFLCNAGGLLIFLCHVFALGFALLLFFGMMLRGAHPTPARVVQGAVRTLALFALPLLLLVFVPRGHEHFVVGYFHKTRMLPALFMAQHVSLGAFGILLLVPLYFLLRNKVVRVDERMHWPLIVAGAFVLLCPSSVENAVDVDSRLLVALAYLFFAALQPCRREREITLVLGGTAAAFAAFQLWSAASIWLAFSNQVDELRQADGIFPANAKVLTVAGDGTGFVADPLAYSHVTSYLTIDRRIFNPLEFTGIGMQPLSVTPAYERVDTPTGQPYSPEIANRFIKPDPALAKLARENGAGFALGWPNKFDYVICYDFGRHHNFNPALLTEVGRGSFFTVFKVTPAGKGLSHS